MANETPDFVQVQLSASGIAFAGEGAQVRIVNGHYNYLFTPGSPVKVLTSEWSRSLSLKNFNGQPILEVAAASAADPAAPTVTEIIPGASHTDAPEQAGSQSGAQPATKSKAAKSAADSEVK